MRLRIALLVLAGAVMPALAACGGGDPPASGPAGADRPAVRPEPATVVWAVGDGGLDTEAARRVAGLIAADEPKHVVYLGDVYETGTRKEFDVNFDAVYGDLVQRMWPTPGNHEWRNHETGYDPFWRETLGRRLPHHYAREVNGWQVLSANSQTPEDPEQLAWLRKQTATGGSCRIAFWHRPRLNAGLHRDQEQDVAPLWDAVAGRAALVLSGHDHNMQRFEPVSGTTQYVAGAGGKTHYPVEAGDPRLAWSDDEADGALRIALAPGRAELRFVTADGEVIDRSTVTCES